MKAHETARGLLDLLTVHDENVSVEIAAAAEMLARHVLATMNDDPLRVLVAVDQLTALTKAARRYEALLMVSRLDSPKDRAACERTLDAVVIVSDSN